MSCFQVLEIADENFPEKLFDSIAENLNVKSLPHVSFKEMRTELEIIIKKLNIRIR